VEKAYRVKKSAEIENIMKNRSSVGDGYFVLYQRKNENLDHFRFAISVPKKYGNAVMRNLMKRRVREIVKQNQFKTNIDFFIIVKTNASSLSFQEIKNHLEKMFVKSKIVEGKE